MTNNDRRNLSPAAPVASPALPLCALALALCSFGGAAHAAPASSADSPYRLRIADSQPYKLRKEEDEAYRLAAPYRSIAKEQAEAINEDPLIAAANAAAQAEAAARRTAEMAAKPHARQIDRAARAASLDPALVHALIYVESRHTANAISPKGAVGLMQVLPDTGARYGIDVTRTTEQNLKAGTRYLRDLIVRFGDRLDLALAAYNAGEGAVQRYANKIPPYPETRDYVRNVLAKYGEWRAPIKPGEIVAVKNSAGDKSEGKVLPNSTPMTSVTLPANPPRDAGATTGVAEGGNSAGSNPNRSSDIVVLRGKDTMVIRDGETTLVPAGRAYTVSQR